MLTGDKMAYNFEHPNNKLIQVREANLDETPDEIDLSPNKKIHDKLAAVEQLWSAPFQLDDLEDF